MSGTKTLIEMPSQYKEFVNPTYVVVVNGYHARIIKGEGPFLEEIERFERDKEELQQKKRYEGVTPSNRTFKVEDEKLQNQIKKDLFHEVTQIISEGLKKKDCKEVLLVIPPEYKSSFNQIAPRQVTESIVKTVPANLTNLSLIDLAKKIQS